MSYGRRHGKSRSKYNNRKTVIDGIVFDSSREAKRYQYLKSLEQIGAIRNLQLQVPIEVIPKQYDENGKVVERAVKYIADFCYIDNMSNRQIIEDAKGFRTAEYVLKRKMMRYIHDLVINEV